MSGPIEQLEEIRKALGDLPDRLADVLRSTQSSGPVRGPNGRYQPSGGQGRGKGGLKSPYGRAGEVAGLAGDVVAPVGFGLDRPFRAAANKLQKIETAIQAYQRLMTMFQPKPPKPPTPEDPFTGPMGRWQQEQKDLLHEAKTVLGPPTPPTPFATPIARPTQVKPSLPPKTKLVPPAPEKDKELIGLRAGNAAGRQAEKEGKDYDEIDAADDAAKQAAMDKYEDWFLLNALEEGEARDPAARSWRDPNRRRTADQEHEARAQRQYDAPPGGPEPTKIDEPPGEVEATAVGWTPPEPAVAGSGNGDEANDNGAERLIKAVQELSAAAQELSAAATGGGKATPAATPERSPRSGAGGQFPTAPVLESAAEEASEVTSSGAGCGMELAEGVVVAGAL